MKPTRRPVSQSSFGLIAWLESTRIALPLKGVECRFDVTGSVASVELDQVYHQDAAQPLDCTYTFPLPAGAAVYRCELHVNGRVIRARVESKEDAKRIYREQKAAGHRTGLVEMERENLFTLSLGNVQPGDLIVVRFAWFQVLDRSGENLRLRVPTCPGIRYIPGNPLLRSASGRGTAEDTDQVPDASRISPPRIDALHPDAAYFCVQGRLMTSEVERDSASSPSHAIHLRENEREMSVELSGRAAVPDQDFVLAWREPKAATLVPRAWRWKEADHSYALVQLRAPADVPVADDYSQDFYFLVDRSGSMEGAKWVRTCEALQAFVGLLGAEDRVWITLFESTFRDFAECPLPAPRIQADPAFQNLVALGVAGGTELLPAARHVLTTIGRHSTKRPATVILITDGQMGNEAAIQAAFRGSPAVTVHTFGIDTAVNDAFLRALARQQRGGCWLQTPDDDIPGTIAALGARLRRPVLTHLSVAAPWELGGGDLPDLHADEVGSFALRSEAAEGSAIVVTGRPPGGEEQCFAVEVEDAGSEAIKLLWARDAIAAHLDAARKYKALDLARTHNLICEGAAFIAWDEAEQVAIAEEEIEQPAMMLGAPAGAQYCDVAMMDACPPLDLCMERPVRLGPIRFGSDSVGANIQTLLAEVRRILARWAISPEWLEEIIASIEGEGAGACQWADHVIQAGRLMQEFSDLIDEEQKYARLCEAILNGMATAMTGTVDDILFWRDAVEGECGPLRHMLHIFNLSEIPIELADRLLTWAWETGTPDAERSAKLLKLIASLDAKGGFFEAPRWQEFLDSATDLSDEIRT